MNWPYLSRDAYDARSLLSASSAFHGFGGLKSSIFGSVAIRRPEGVGYAAPVTESWREGARPGASFGVSLLK